jgi:hypothetical protein
VFSIHIYQLYAYPSFRAWVAGSLLWARFSSGRENTFPLSQTGFKLNAFTVLDLTLTHVENQEVQLLLYLVKLTASGGSPEREPAAPVG